MPGPDVSGGAGGISARFADIEALAGFFDTSADELRAPGMRLAPLGTSSVMAGAALLCPLSAAKAEAAMNLPVLGPRGMLWLGVQTEAYARLMRAVVTGYRDVDRAQVWATDVDQWVTGFVVGVTAPLLVPVAVVVALGDVVVNDPRIVLKMPVTHRVGDADVDAIRKHLAADVADWVNTFVVTHPGVVETMVGGSAGLVNGIEVWLPPSMQGRVPHPGTFDEAVDGVAKYFPDGSAVVSPGGNTQPGDAEAPVNVADLLAGVNRRQNRGPDNAVPGEIGVQRVVGADGKVRLIVQLPGTEVWPLTPGPELRDLATNLHITGGDLSMYQVGVEKAMRDAGIGKGDEVMLVGHSQGGMLAGQMASDPRVLQQFNITQVVTAGAPLGRDRIDPRVQVLALEDRYDVVPQLEGRGNADRANVTTVVFNDQRGDVGCNHSLTAYTDRASQLPVADPSVVAWKRSASPFLSGTSVKTNTYVVSREIGKK